MAPKKTMDQQILEIVTRVEERMEVLERKFNFLEELNVKIQHLETRLDNLDAERRRRNVVIHDLPPELVTEQAIIKHITTNTDLDVQPSSALRNSFKGKAGPVIIKFDRDRDATNFINKARTTFKAKRDLPPTFAIETEPSSSTRQWSTSLGKGKSNSSGQRDPDRRATDHR